MRLVILTIATILVFGGVIVNLVSDDIADRLSSWLGPNYEPVIYITFAVVFILDVWLFAKDRLLQRPAVPGDRDRDEFEAIWPTFFQTLTDDLRRSEATAEVARLRATDRKPHPGIEIHSPSIATEFTLYHQRTVSNHDSELGKLLRNYLKTSDQLRIAANSYNQLLYADLQEGPDFGKVDRLEGRADYRRAKEDMYAKSRALEAP